MKPIMPSIILGAAFMAAPLPAFAQDLQPSATRAAGDQIVVIAQRSGAPMWTIETDTGTVILVGEIAAVPKSTPWLPDQLKEATAQAQRVIIRSRPKFSPGDVFRLIFSGSRFTKLPDDKVASDYLVPAQRARLADLEAEYDKDYSRGSFLITGFDLLTRRLDFDEDTTKDATEIVRKAAKKGDIPIQRLDRFRGEDLLDNLAAADPASHIPCLMAAMTATEDGQEIIERRGQDWRAFDVPAVMANPLEIALGQCWPWADDDLGAEIRELWTDAIVGAAGSQGVTLAVAPLRVLAEMQGVLDQLESQGFLISGPDWRGG